MAGRWAEKGPAQWATACHACANLQYGFDGSLHGRIHGKEPSHWPMLPRAALLRPASTGVSPVCWLLWPAGCRCNRFGPVFIHSAQSLVRSLGRQHHQALEVNAQGPQRQRPCGCMLWYLRNKDKKKEGVVCVSGTGAMDYWRRLQPTLGAWLASCLLRRKRGHADGWLKRGAGMFSGGFCLMLMWLCRASAGCDAIVHWRRCCRGPGQLSRHFS